MKLPRQRLVLVWALILLCSCSINFCHGQDYEDGSTSAPPPPEQENCDGIFITYNFIERQKEYPHVKNATAQSWAFKSELTVLNTGVDELKSWKVFIGFQYNEILVGASGAVLYDGNDLPAKVGNNGTTLAGYPQTDLKTSIDTAGDLDQIQARIELTGTQFGLKPSAAPMPKKIRLANDGYKCPSAHHRGKSSMHVCCVKDKKHKVKETKTKFLPRQYGDLSFTYDVLQAYENNYLAQVTIDNNNPLGRLDHWNLTWEWMRGEFIYSMRGAYTHKIDYSECIYGAAGQYYQDFDFSQVMNCEKKPVIADLPADRVNDSKVGKLPFCCRNGSLLPALMDESKARSIFQLQVYKIPPDMNRTSLYPPQRWRINGLVNPDYKCGAPIRVDASQFPDPSGLQAISTAIASWQVTCNITHPKAKESKCCVSYSAYYNTSVIPCNTCACGCADSVKCNRNAHPMLLPYEALLVPFVNRTAKAKAWAKIKHFPIPNPMPCPDNCGVSINWHIETDHTERWVARVTLFNWDNYPFENWFAAIQMKKTVLGFERAFSFNATTLRHPNNTIFFQGLPGLNYLMGEVNGTHPWDPRVPGKQQSVIMFSKKLDPNIDIPRGDGFPTKVFFNGEECSLPTVFPKVSAGNQYRFNSLLIMVTGIASFMLMKDLFH